MEKPYSKQAKRLIGYFGYAVFIGYIMLWGATIQQKLIHTAATTFNGVPRFVFMIAFPVFIGILLALPGFIANVRSNGHWKIDWAKLLGVGLPAFYITICPLLYAVAGDMALGGYTQFFISRLFFDDILRTVSGLALGYLILSVIQKVKYDD
ncbi:MAG: hypothetical protein APF84_13800 [Gracilibacter sp. BRH_c7a]|nr:MAG: hypothetical protein APF84_13800 [Gracilibacter sp. BRH_c7a]